MDTPIVDFVREYAKSGAVRLHMPGHKGSPLLGPEELDITELPGADILYSAKGIIKRSEENASRLFGSAMTLYSTEGSTLSIRAMLWLVRAECAGKGRAPVILAARNAHRSFLTGCMLLGIEVFWLYPESGGLHGSKISASSLKKALKELKPDAVYLTSPDYIGGMADIAEASRLCKAHGALLLVDNAHGGYLRFLEKSLHPLDLGADLVCDSAHKTLPVLTGGGYLHISGSSPGSVLERAEEAMAVFASTSPSYLILQSLDMANRLLDGGLPERIQKVCRLVGEAKKRLSDHGIAVCSDEPMKLCLMPKSYGYTGDDMSMLLAKKGIYCEFSDPDYLTLMPSGMTSPNELERAVNQILMAERRQPILSQPPKAAPGERVLSCLEAMLLARKRVPISCAVGEVFAGIETSCPPAIPPVICGERITLGAARLLEYYGVTHCDVVDV